MVRHSETGRSVQGPEAGRGGDSMPHARRAAGVAWRGATVSWPGVPGWLHPSREANGDPGCGWSSGGKEALPGGPEACAGQLARIHTPRFQLSLKIGAGLHSTVLTGAIFIWPFQSPFRLAFE